MPKFAATAGLRSFQMKLSYQKCRIPTEYSAMRYWGQDTHSGRLTLGTLTCS